MLNNFFKRAVTESIAAKSVGKPIVEMQPAKAIDNSFIDTSPKKYMQAMGIDEDIVPETRTFDELLTRENEKAKEYLSWPDNKVNKFKIDKEITIPNPFRMDKYYTEKAEARLDYGYSEVYDPVESSYRYKLINDFGLDDILAQSKEGYLRAEEQLSEIAQVTGLPKTALGLNGALRIKMDVPKERFILSNDQQVSYPFPHGIYGQYFRQMNQLEDISGMSMYHEWLHALDNYFGKVFTDPTVLENLEQTGNKVFYQLVEKSKVELPSYKIKSEYDILEPPTNTGNYGLTDKDITGYIREELKPIYQELFDSIINTPEWNDLIHGEGLYNTKYLMSPIEKLARSFETWLRLKLGKPALLAEDHPYPIYWFTQNEQEASRIFNALSNFFSQLKTVTTKYGTAIYTTAPLAMGAGAAASAIGARDSNAAEKSKSYAEGGLVQTDIPSFTDQDLEDISLSAWAENRDRLPEAIAWVVRNRKEKWGKHKSYSDVVRNTGFAPFRPGIANDPQYGMKPPVNDPRYDAVKARVRNVLEDRIPDITEGATGFYNPDAMDFDPKLGKRKPSKWHEERKETTRLYGHRFNSDELINQTTEQEAGPFSRLLKGVK